MYRKLYSKIMSLTLMLCMIVTLFIPSCNVKAADIAMEYTSYEVLQWILMELGISASLAPEKQQAIVLPDGQEITEPNLGAELIREVNDSIELWWNANQMDDVVDGYDGGFEQFKSDFADMLEWGKDGVIEIGTNVWTVLSEWGMSLHESISKVGEMPEYKINMLNVPENLSFRYQYFDIDDYTYTNTITRGDSPVNLIGFVGDNLGANRYRAYATFYLFSSAPFKINGYDCKQYKDIYYYSNDGSMGSWFYDFPCITYDVYGYAAMSDVIYAYLSKILHGNLSDVFKDVIWQPTDLKTDICGIPWELPDSVPYPHSGDATITIPQDLPIDDAITGVGTGELTWEDVIGKTFPIPIDKPIDKPAEGDTETDTEKDTEEETESEKEIEWDDTIFAPDGAIGGKLSELSKKFPFCIPFDVVALFKGFGKDVVETAPRWEVSIDMPFIDYTWKVVIDMKDYEKYVKIFRDGFYLLFLVGLFFTTRKLISWQID